MVVTSPAGFRGLVPLSNLSTTARPCMSMGDQLVERLDGTIKPARFQRSTTLQWQVLGSLGGMAHSGPKEKTVTIMSSVTRIARLRAEARGDRPTDLTDPVPLAVKGGGDEVVDPGRSALIRNSLTLSSTMTLTRTLTWTAT